MNYIKYMGVALLLLTNLYSETFTNELIHQDSPYLQQHAHHPVHWMAWSEETLEKAKKENKLIFLSIGYSTCHWCHVMERETFTQLSSAKILNTDYIAIKVDKEEMPDVDKYYQNIYSLINQRSGGWPLNIIMTPQREVIYADTYIPAQTRGNKRSFNTLLTLISNTFKSNPQEIINRTKEVDSIIKQQNHSMNKKSRLNLKILNDFVNTISEEYDEDYKGIGISPKFPNSSTFDALLDIYKVTGNKQALKMSQDALKAMAKGGIYDQIEGGFFRYSTDESWMIPHFEKMLYTNAELITLYSKMYTIEPIPLYKKVVQETINNMNDQFFYQGLYKSASDADSEESEGKYFVFSYNKAKKALQDAGIKNTEEILQYFNITKNGNFKNETTNPYLTQDKIPNNINKAKEALKALREETTYPFIDSKLSTSWNALMASALFEAGNIDEQYSKQALALVDNIVLKLEKNGVLYHQLLPNSTLKVKGYLEDYSFLIDALIQANQYTQNKKYLLKATNLLNEAVKKFYSNKNWFLSDGEFTSKASLQAGSYKSAMAQMIENIFVVSLLNEDGKLQNLATENLKNISYKIKNYPSAFAQTIKILIMNKKALILLHGKSDKIAQLKKIKKEVNYPYVYLLESNESMLEACSTKECFSSSKDATQLEEDIKNYIQNN